MKKTLFGILLSLAMIVSQMTGMTLTAWADPAYGTDADYSSYKNNSDKLVKFDVVNDYVRSIDEKESKRIDEKVDTKVNKEEDVTHCYLVKTSNMEDTNGNIIKNKYRDHTRTLCVTKKANTDRYEIPLNTN